MRTRVITTFADGRTTERYRDLYKEPMADDTVHLQGLASVTYEWTDGSKSQYFHAEYECEWCGQYGHGSVESCPNFDKDGNAINQTP